MYNSSRVFPTEISWASHPCVGTFTFDPTFFYLSKLIARRANFLPCNLLRPFCLYSRSATVPMLRPGEYIDRILSCNMDSVQSNFKICCCIIGKIRVSSPCTDLLRYLHSIYRFSHKHWSIVTYHAVNMWTWLVDNRTINREHFSLFPTPVNVLLTQK